MKSKILKKALVILIIILSILIIFSLVIIAINKSTNYLSSKGFMASPITIGNGSFVTSADHNSEVSENYSNGVTASTLKTETAAISVSAYLNNSSIENASGSHTFTPPTGYKLSGAYVVSAYPTVNCMSRGLTTPPKISGNTVTAYLTLGYQSNVTMSLSGVVNVIVIYTVS